MWDHNASYGAALQNLRYTDSRSKGRVYSDPTTLQKTLYGLFTVGGRYAWDKWESWLIDQEGGYDEVTISMSFDETQILTLIALASRPPLV